MPRKPKIPEHVNHERWLVSYADFITLLFAFFTTLYSISSVDQKKAGKLMYSMMTALHLDFFPNPKAVAGSALNNPQLIPIEQLAILATKRREKEPESMGQGSGMGADARGDKRLQGLASSLQRLVGGSILKNRVQVKLDRRGIIISLAEAGFFDPGAAELREGALEALTVIAQELQQPSLDITVEGHSDNTPTRGGRYKTNWELSTARATFVVVYFITKHGFSPDHLSAMGYGEFRPVDSNATPAGRARNRRVDIVVRSQPSREANDSLLPPLTPVEAPPAPKGTGEEHSKKGSEGHH